MSALEEYRKACRIADEIMSEQYATTLTASTVPREYADMAIAELEVERDKWQARFIALDIMNAELDTENVKLKADAMSLIESCLGFKTALVERDRMLELAWHRTFWVDPEHQPTLDEWLADLKARAEEGSE